VFPIVANCRLAAHGCLGPVLRSTSPTTSAPLCHIIASVCGAISGPSRESHPRPEAHLRLARFPSKWRYASRGDPERWATSAIKRRRARWKSLLDRRFWKGFIGGQYSSTVTLDHAGHQPEPKARGSGPPSAKRSAFPPPRLHRTQPGPRYPPARHPMVLEMSMESLFAIVDAFFRLQPRTDSVAAVASPSTLLLRLFDEGKPSRNQG